MERIVAIVTMGGVIRYCGARCLAAGLAESLLPPIWFSPLEEPMMMLGLCLGFGHGALDHRHFDARSCADQGASNLGCAV